MRSKNRQSRHALAAIAETGCIPATGAMSGFGLAAMAGHWLHRRELGRARDQATTSKAGCDLAMLAANGCTRAAGAATWVDESSVCRKAPGVRRHEVCDDPLGNCDANGRPARFRISRPFVSYDLNLLASSTPCWHPLASRDPGLHARSLPFALQNVSQKASVSTCRTVAPSSAPSPMYISLVKSTRWNKVTVSPDVAAKVAAAAARVGLTKEQALAIMAAEPRYTTVYAGQVRKAPSRPRSGR